MRLNNKIILITGATSGIGFAAAQRAIEEGGSVIFTARDHRKIIETQKKLGSHSMGFICDHSDLNAQDTLITDFKKRNFKFDGVFLNAGNVHHEKFGAWTESTFDQVFNTNIKGPFFLLQSLIPVLNEGSSIILCGSTSIHIALEQSSVYAASKITLKSLAKTLSRELIPYKIRVNLLSPGPTLTSALDKIATDQKAREKLQLEIQNLVPIQRLADAVEIADAFIYLISDESRFVVGTELLIDGGVASL